MPLPTRPSGELGRAIRKRLDNRECPLCGHRTWDFEGAQVVFVMGVDYPAATERQLRMTGVRLSSSGGPASETSMRVLKEAGRDNRLVQISCDTCGHAELLDARKLVG